MNIAALVASTVVTLRPFGRILAHPLAFFVTALLAAGPLLAQNASLTGSIIDPSQGLIADASIVAISTGTNARYRATTDASGEYTLENLPPSNYRIEVEKPGFKKLINSN